MENVLVGAVIGLAIAVVILAARLLAVRRSLDEISAGFSRGLTEDTNNVITVSSSDKKVRKLAGKLNAELSFLRGQRLKLERSSTELQQAVTNAAHDLRTPLTAISGYLELLEQEKLDGTQEKYVGIIRERTESLKALTEELFRYSVISTTSDELNPETLSLNDELEVALAGAYQSLAGRGITPEISFPAAAVLRKLDRKALQRVLGNILSNAAKYSDGDLKVTLDEKGTIVFSNAAPSLSEVEVGKLFDRFYTVENARGSTGLGLSIARLLTERMGGDISAHYAGGVLSVCLRFPQMNLA